MPLHLLLPLIGAAVPVSSPLLLPASSAPLSRPFVHYTGSLTTPPCSEEVDWFVFTEPIKVPDRQVLQVRRRVLGFSKWGF